MLSLKKKYLKIIIAIVSVFVVLVVLSKVGDNPVQRTLYTIMSPIYSAGEKIVTPIRKFANNVKKANSYEEEIAALKKQVNDLKIENRSLDDYITENKRLKELLGLKDGMTDSKTVAARVISYEPNSWYDTVVINRGENAGISKGNAVITGLGVVGKVVRTGKNWAKVSTLINISDSVGVKLSRTGDIGVVSGDALLAENKLCKLEYMSNGKNLIPGDVLLTSGLGGIYPSDLTVGKITQIKSDSAGNLEYAVVEPSVDFSALYEVLVITYHSESEDADLGGENSGAEE